MTNNHLRTETTRTNISAAFRTGLPEIDVETVRARHHSVHGRFVL